MDTPSAYRGREQTFLKHRALWEYETEWGLKVGPSARKLWYVDGFAGAWKSQDEDYQDTSVHLGIEALQAPSIGKRLLSDGQVSRVG